MKQRKPLPTTFDTRSPVLTLRRGAADGELSKSDRESLLADVRGNPGTTARLTIVANTYLQGANQPNSKCVRVRDGAMRALARSFRDTPFLRDHDAYDFLARGGTVVECELVDLEGDQAGMQALRQTIELVKPWAIEAALDGTLDRFSVAFRATGPISCTICGGEYAPGWFGLYASCEHELGETYDLKGGGQAICQAEYESAQGVECSGVSVPAVQGTGIDSVRAALAAARDGSLTPAQRAELSALIDPNQENSTMKFATIAAVLGLAAAAEETAIVAEISRRDTLLSAERTARTEAEARLAAVQEQQAGSRRAELSARALREGKVRPGSDLAARIDALALSSIETAEALVNELPRVTPVGAALASSAAAATTGPGAETAGVTLSAEETEVLRQLNAGGAQLTVAEFLAAKRAPAMATPTNTKAGASA